MNDLISRQAAIDALYNVDEYNGRSVEAIRNLSSAQRWIAVSEKPKKNGEYLVTKIDRITHDRIVDIAHYANFIHDNNGFYKTDAVIAWMPLPEPYRKETEDGTTN